MTDQNQNPVHKFEAAGLGVAPFKVVGFSVEKYQACQGAPIQPGTCCDYCGTGIMNTYWVQGRDGRRFKVGCDCVEKTGDKGMIRVVKRMDADRERKARKTRVKNRTGRMFGLLQVAAVRDALAALPHPMAFRADNGDTALDWADWMIRNAGDAGRTRVAKVVEEVATGAGVDLDGVTPMTKDEYLNLTASKLPEPEAPAPVPVPEPEALAPVSQHVGTVGKRIDVAVTVGFVADWETNYGRQYLVNMVDGEGNVFVWKTSNPTMWKGDIVTINGQVKSHGSYNGVLQTVLSRVYVLTAFENDYEIRRVGRLYHVFKDGQRVGTEDFHCVFSARQGVARGRL